MSGQSYESFDEFIQEDGASEQAVRDYIAGKAAAHPEFRRMLLADPCGTVASEIGMEVPDSINFMVHEETGKKFHLVLPSSDELSGAELGDIAAGCGWCPPPNNNDSGNIASADHND